MVALADDVAGWNGYLGRFNVYEMVLVFAEEIFVNMIHW
jgi:hypothetical protein